MDTRLNVPLGVVRELVDRARLAPSTHNTQPWSWTVVPCPQAPSRACGLELHRLPGRVMTFGDPAGRELVISCGAALLTMRVAAAERLLDTVVEVLPDPARPDLLARVGFVDNAVDAAFSGLDAAVAARHTWRREFTDRPVPPGLLDRLVAEAAAEGARLHVLTPDDVTALTALVRASESDRNADRQRRAELAGWLRPRWRGDGLPVPLLGLVPARIALRQGLLGRRLVARDCALLLAAPAAVILSTRGEGTASWLAAGQALQRILLVAAAGGLAAGFANGPCQQAGHRAALQALLGGETHPQVVMRLGYPAAPGRAVPRRRLEDLLVWPVVAPQRTGSADAGPAAVHERPADVHAEEPHERPSDLDSEDELG